LFFGSQSDAINSHGNRVKVTQYININGIMVRQYFYETFCARNDSHEEDEVFGTTIMKAHEDRQPFDQKCIGIDESVSLDYAIPHPSLLLSSLHL
jgi:hypothetical protein